jgi:uncharacterized membrane protein (UPF0136 family)
MFSVDPSFVYVAYLECAAIGLILGVVSGILVSIFLKLRIRGRSISLDGFLGATVSVLIVSVLWHLGFRYNFVAAVLFAIAVPALHQFYCFRRQGRAE